MSKCSQSKNDDSRAKLLSEWPSASNMDRVVSDDIQRYILKGETFQFVQDYLAFMLDARGYSWDQSLDLEDFTNRFGSDSGRNLLKLANHFRPLFRRKFQKIGEVIMNSRSDLQVYIWTFGERLFKGTFHWDKMAGFLVFCSELGVLCMDYARPELMDIVDNTMTSYILVRHFHDVLKHGCWFGFLEHCEQMVLERVTKDEQS